jgi:hypothetical protein
LKRRRVPQRLETAALGGGDRGRGPRGHAVLYALPAV